MEWFKLDRNGRSLTQLRYVQWSAGIQTAGLIFGGETPSTCRNRKLDGSSWTEVRNLNTARMSNRYGSMIAPYTASASGI